MKQKHNLEYQNHKPKLYIDFITTQILLMTLFLFGIFQAQATGCEAFQILEGKDRKSNPIFYEDVGIWVLL